MLAYRHDAAWHIWPPGTRLPSGLTPPPNAESVFTAADLLKVGLALVTRESVPAGQRATAWALVDVEGAPVYQPTLEAVPVVVPHEVTNFQMRAALSGIGLLETVDAAVEATGDPIAVAAWQYANHVYRDGLLVNSMAGALGLSQADLDALFIAAEAIVA